MIQFGQPFNQSFLNTRVICNGGINLPLSPLCELYTDAALILWIRHPGHQTIPFKPVDTVRHCAEIMK